MLDSTTSPSVSNQDIPGPDSQSTAGPRERLGRQPGISFFADDVVAFGERGEQLVRASASGSEAAGLSERRPLGLGWMQREGKRSRQRLLGYSCRQKGENMRNRCGRVPLMLS